MDNSFYNQTKLLDKGKSEQNPQTNLFKLVLSLIQEEKFARYFFSELENPNWICPLYEQGFFFKTPEPVEVNPGSFQIPGWPAGEYLVRFANQFEDIVIDIVQSISTENWRVQEILVDAMMKISPAKTSGLIPAIGVWLSGRFSNMLPIKLSKLSVYLLENGSTDAAIKILEYLVTPVLISNQRKNLIYHSKIRFRSDHYWVNQFFESQFPKLIQQNPIGVLSAFDRQLEKAIELTSKIEPENAESRVGYSWRLDIPYRLSERDDADALDILIDGLRDSLAEVCRQDFDYGKSILNYYLNNHHVIFKRIALYTLRSFGHNYPELVNQAFLQRDFLDDTKYINEYRGLLRDQFHVASEAVRSQVISWILTGPTDVEKRAKNLAKWENREANDDDRCRVKEKWILSNLEQIREFLEEDTLANLDKLTDKYGKPDISEKPSVGTTTWGGSPSPISMDDLSKKTFEEIKQFFLTYIPDDLFFNSRESLAETFQRLVSNDPRKFSGFASLLADTQIRFVYVYHYVSGIREGIVTKGGILTEAILNLCQYTVAQRDDPFVDSSGRYEPGLFAAHLEVARLLEKALHTSDPYLTRKQLDLIRAILVDLAHHSDPTSDADSGANFDPFTHSLNCVRGVAMHGIFQYSLYIIRQQENQSGEKQKIGSLEPEIEQLIEEKLDVYVEPSLAVHSVFGAFVPQLNYLSSEWLEKNLIKIFPDAEDKEAYWKATWDAYIFVSNVYPNVFKLLISQYQRGLSLLSQPQNGEKHLGGSPNERLAQHIMFAYLAGLTDFDHENKLLEMFFENASDSIRSQGVFWLSKVLGNDQPTGDDILWKKCWILWQKRLEFAETQEVAHNSQEMSDFMRWLANCPVGLDVLFNTLQKSIKYLHDGFDARQLIEFASNHCNQHPLEAIMLFEMIVKTIKETWWTSNDEAEEKILRSAMLSNDEKAIKIASEIINYRGEQGDFRWKYLLDID